MAEQQGVNLRDSALRIGMFGAEPWSEAMRREIEARMGLRAVDIYGLSEIMGPGVACECEVRNGLHGWGRPFPVRDHRPRQRRAGARRRTRRAGDHHAHQAGAADAALPHARHHAARAQPSAIAAARTCASCA